MYAVVEEISGEGRGKNAAALVANSNTDMSGSANVGSTANVTRTANANSTANLTGTANTNSTTPPSRSPSP